MYKNYDSDFVPKDNAKIDLDRYYKMIDDLMCHSDIRLFKDLPDFAPTYNDHLINMNNSLVKSETMVEEVK